jgi:hypothetical protein
MFFTDSLDSVNDGSTTRMTYAIRIVKINLGHLGRLGIVREVLGALE